MKKILYIVSTLKRGGPVNQLYNLIKYLDRKEFDPYLITLSPELPDSRIGDFRSMDISIWTLNCSRRYFLSALKQARRICREIKPDLIHSQGIRPDAVSIRLDWIVPRINRIANFFQDDYKMTYGPMKGTLMTRFHLYLIRKMSLCIGVSKAVIDNLKEKCNSINCTVISNGIDTDIYYPALTTDKKDLRNKLGLPESKNLWISCGHLSPLKNPVFLIQEWLKEFAADDNHHLILVGNGPLEHQCKELSAQGKNIHIIGRITNVVDYLKAADYFISVSRSEGMPNVVLEAMACGLPVLLSDIPPHREIINYIPDAGKCFELDNGKSFMESVHTMMRADRNCMSAAALQVIQEWYNAKRMSAQYQELYHRLIDL